MDKLLDLVGKYKIASIAPANQGAIESLWKEYMMKDTPMGCLFSHNDFKSQLDDKKNLILLHASLNVEEIKRDKTLFSSGGGLGGVVYCTPVNSDGSAHNLTGFILNEELPGFISHRNSQPHPNIGLVAIEIPFSLFKSKACSLAEISYIEFGKEYLNSYDRLLRKGKISSLKNESVLKSLEKEFKGLIPFIRLFCPSMYEVPTETFIHLLEKNIPKSEMILNCYFETVLEYFYLHQNDENAFFAKNRGELNNYSVKKMIFDIVPGLYDGFSTRKFKVKPSDLVDYVKRANKRSRFIKKFDSDHFYLYLRWRLSYYIFVIMLGGIDIKKNHNYSSNEIIEKYPNLAGQLKYKIMQSDSHLIEAEFSKNFLSSGSDIKIVLYKNIPKGELGLRVNKANDIRFFEAHINEDHKVILGNQIDINISNKLIEPQNSVMRDPSYSNERPLYILAKSKSLGELQIMDRETLTWIEQRTKNYVFKPSSKLPFLFKEDIQILEKYFPRKIWFLSKPHSEGIHGRRHIGRVSLFALLLCNYISTSADIKYCAFLASIVHDLRRLNDNKDINHGDRSAKWLKENLNPFRPIINKFDIDIDDVALAVKYHNIESSQIPDSLTDNCMKTISILKTADALDRFRQPKESWWPDAEKLLEPSATELIFLARRITLHSENQYLNGIDAKTAVLDSTNFIKLM